MQKYENRTNKESYSIRNKHLNLNAIRTFSLFLPHKVHLSKTMLNVSDSIEMGRQIAYIGRLYEKLIFKEVEYSAMRY